MTSSMASSASKDMVISSLKCPSEQGPNVVIVGTCDSKLGEILLLRRYILNAGASSVSIIDVGRSRVSHEDISVHQDVVAEYCGGKSAEDVASLPRGEVIQHMSGVLCKLLEDSWELAGFHGVVSAGGSGGSSLVAPAMRDALPIGFPKLLVSTVASGDTGLLVGESDVTMMYSVVDIAGTNSLLRTIFSNAAGAIVGMARSYQQRLATLRATVKNTDRKTKVGVTMFGVTTPCVDACRRYLESEHNCEVFVFHATGHGGKAMERLVEAGELDAVLDITTTEICDHLMGGNMSAGGSRLEATLKRRIPYVISLGATSMVNFGSKATVPPKYAERLLFEHNSTVTLMRTSKVECQRIGEFIVDKLKNFCKDPQKVQVVLPLGGICMISTPGAPFADAEADEMLFETLRSGLANTGIAVIEDQRAINDEAFAIEISQRLVALLPSAH